MRAQVRTSLCARCRWLPPHGNTFESPLPHSLTHTHAVGAAKSTARQEVRRENCQCLFDTWKTADTPTYTRLATLPTTHISFHLIARRTQNGFISFLSRLQLHELWVGCIPMRPLVAAWYPTTCISPHRIHRCQHTPRAAIYSHSHTHRQQREQFLSRTFVCTPRQRRRK